MVTCNLDTKELTNIQSKPIKNLLLTKTGDEKSVYILDELNKSWQYLKQRFTGERHLKPSGSQGTKKQWTHLKSLAFLNNVYEHTKNTTCNMSTENDIGSPTAQEKRSPDYNQVHLKRNRTNNDVGELIQILKKLLLFIHLCNPLKC
ncbi:Hypothetical protein CINCED_3A017066 [Cinara cedri]|uniref:MADF domain n=1 Tax=Cinara cedri TaxID=506608 RepID=A0A5E4MGI3_9HEMI|nr:Hypothetical protein CINCED_3A017066 [Cinara cedri]